MWKFFIVLVLSLALTAQGLFFKKERDSNEVVQYPSEDINNKCLQFSEESNCELYTCLERRFPCGRDGYAHRFGLYYCPRVKGLINEFNAAGKIWINATMKCHIYQMKKMYTAKGASCDQIAEAAFAAQRQCFIENGFCKVGWENREALWTIFKPSDAGPTAPHSKEIWKNIGKISSTCIMEKTHDFTAWIKSHGDLFIELKEKIKNKAKSFWEKIKSKLG